MKKYKFLLKPVLFIFNLLFATWLVFKIEQIKPSDFGKKDPVPVEKIKIKPESNQLILKKLFLNYQSGMIDSLTFDKKLEEFIQAVSKGK